MDLISMAPAFHMQPSIFTLAAAFLTRVLANYQLKAEGGFHHTSPHHNNTSIQINL